ncbi:hypothetical protein JCM19992_31170 [Thermostilla marina]
MRHARFIVAAFWCAVAVGPAVLSAADEAKQLVYGRPRIGMNLSGPADWNTELPFVDVFRMSRPWISQRAGAGWGQGPELELDRWGWVKRLEPGCYAETMLCTIAGGHYPAGRYTVLYDGEGELAFAKNARIVSQEPGKIVIEVDASRGGFSLQIRKTNPADYVRNIHVIMPGFEDTWQENPFHPAFLRRWQGMACFRFMDWMHTNGSEVEHWDDRPTLQHATFSKRGVALEFMIDLCNRTKTDPWFCMPHKADDEFVRRFARMVHERLDPSLHVYIEYSNEVWNGQFPQNHYAGERGIALGLGPQDRPWEAAWHYTAVRSVEIFKIWEDVFGGHERLIRVLPSQAANTHVAEQILSFRNAAEHADVLAVAPYMSFSVGRGKLGDMADEMQDWSVEQLLDSFEQTGFADSLRWMEANKQIADKYGLGLVAYEGGQHMVAFVRDREVSDKLTALMHAANRHPRMGELYKRYLDHWAEIGGGTFANFSSIGRWSVHGSWGLAEYYDSTPDEYPKLKAVLEWAAAHGQNVYLP